MLPNGNHVEATFDFVESTVDLVETTFDFVERIVRVVAFDNVASTSLLVSTRVNGRYAPSPVDVAKRPLTVVIIIIIIIYTFV